MKFRREHGSWRTMSGMKTADYGKILADVG
jgi:hypothetical protein